MLNINTLSPKHPIRPFLNNKGKEQTSSAQQSERLPQSKAISYNDPSLLPLYQSNMISFKSHPHSLTPVADIAEEYFPFCGERKDLTGKYVEIKLEEPTEGLINLKGRVLAHHDGCLEMLDLKTKTIKTVRPYEMESLNIDDKAPETINPNLHYTANVKELVNSYQPCFGWLKFAHNQEDNLISGEISLKKVSENYEVLDIKDAYGNHNLIDLDYISKFSADSTLILAPGVPSTSLVDELKMPVSKPIMLYDKARATRLEFIKDLSNDLFQKDIGMFDNPKVYEYLNTNPPYMKELFGRWYGESVADESMALLEEVGGKQHACLLADPGITSRFHSFIDFIEESGIDAERISPIDLRQAFSEHLGESTVYRCIALTEDVAKNIEQHGLMSKALIHTPEATLEKVLLTMFDSNENTDFYAYTSPKKELKGKISGNMAETTVMPVTTHKEIAESVGWEFRDDQTPDVKPYLFEITAPEISQISPVGPFNTLYRHKGIKIGDKEFSNFRYSGVEKMMFHKIPAKNFFMKESNPSPPPEMIENKCHADINNPLVPVSLQTWTDFTSQILDNPSSILSHGRLSKVEKYLNGYESIFFEPQHKFHDFSVGVHTSEAYKHLLESEEFRQLDKKEQQTALLVTIFHDLKKEFRWDRPYENDSDHAKKSAKAMRSFFRQSSLLTPENKRVCTLIEKHHLLGDLAVTRTYHPEDFNQDDLIKVAKEIGNKEDLQLLKLFTEADIKSVKKDPDRLFTDKFSANYRQTCAEIKQLIEQGV